MVNTTAYGRIASSRIQPRHFAFDPSGYAVAGFDLNQSSGNTFDRGQESDVPVC
jgi:hypothetical protein